MSAAIHIWCVTDDKPGHRSQLAGLSGALAERARCEVHWLSSAAQPQAEAAKLACPPDLILCAGHRTHWPAIRLKWRYGGLLVALLQPSLPRWLFDLCVVPEHDAPRASKRLLTTIGTLSDVRPTSTAQDDRGLILIGGPSRGHAWDTTAMIEQLHALLRAMPATYWTLTTSRRTPDTFLSEVATVFVESPLALVPAAETDRDWLRRQYAECGVIWVSEDSASMVYEALSAGARVGVLAVPRNRDSRVSRGLDALLAQGRVTSLAGLCETGVMNPGMAALDEAGRVAEVLLSRLDNTKTNKKDE